MQVNYLGQYLNEQMAIRCQFDIEYGNFLSFKVLFKQIDINPSSGKYVYS